MIVKRIAAGFGILVLLLLGYLLLWPVPIEPEGPWTPPPLPARQGDYAANDYLADVEVLAAGQAPGPEDIAIDAEGYIYGGLENGDILRLDPDGTNPQIFANTGGRALGMHFDADGNLIITDTISGLLSVNPGGEVTVLATEAEGIPFGFPEELDIASDGTIYFTDGAVGWGVDDYTTVLLEHAPKGRFMAYHPDTGEIDVLADDFYFANGVTLAHDESYVLVVDMGQYRLRRYWLEGPQAGEWDVFFDNLPFFTDNLFAGTDGIYWVAGVSPRTESLDALMPRPWLRKVIVRLPQAVQPDAQTYGWVLGIDGDGNVVYNLQDPSPDAYGPITCATEYDGYLYLGSFTGNGIGRIERP